MSVIIRHPILGWPIVTAESCFTTIRNLGIRAWPKLAEPVPIQEWLASANPGQLADYQRFMPKGYAIQHENPHTGATFDAFRVEFKQYALVIAVIDGKYIAMTAEWKHGNDRITIVPVCGVASKAEASLPTLAEQMQATAFREYREETGLELERVIPLSGRNGIAYSVRNSLTQCFPYLGVIKTPIVKGPTKFDDTEHLAMALFPIKEALRLIEDITLFDENPEFALEDCTRASVYAALRSLNMLHYVGP